MLSIRWQDHARNVEVTNRTGLSPLIQSWTTLSNIVTSLSVTLPGCPALSQSIKLHAVRLTSPLAVSQTDHGNVVPAVLRKMLAGPNPWWQSMPGSRCVERCRQKRSSKSDTTVFDDCALTTTMTNITKAHSAIKHSLSPELSSGTKFLIS